MLNLVIWAYWRIPVLALSKKKGITEPREPITFPYRTTEKCRSLSPLTLLAAMNNLSEHNLVAPYKFMGAAALSVLNATTLLTPVSRQACTTFSDPSTFVFINSIGLYSAAGTCFSAAACTTVSILSRAL